MMSTPLVMSVRRLSRVALPMLGAAVLLPQGAAAQDRLIGTGAIGTGVTIDAVRFGGIGYQQPGVNGRDSTRLRSIAQLSVPVSVALPIGSSWTIDVGSAFSYVRLEYDPKLGETGARRTSTLFGPTDVRVRATGRLWNDGLVLTAGVNAPTGQTELDATGLNVLRASAAPALGLATPPVGAGPSATMGVVAAKQILGFAVAIGGSYEARGTYQPVAALVAGAPSTDFAPGHVVRGTLGIDRLVGSHRVSLTGAVDLYSDDVLRDPANISARPVSTIRLGPVYTTDFQLQLAAARVRELVIWGTNRYRTRYTRDAVEIAGTSGNYLDGGIRTTVPLSSSTDLLLTGDTRWHTGLAANQGLATSGVVSGGGTLGLITRVGNFSIQPYLRGQGGLLRPRVLGTTPRTDFYGASAGLVIVSRF